MLANKVVLKIIITKEDVKQLKNLVNLNYAITFKMVRPRYAQIVLFKMIPNLQTYWKFLVIVANVFYQLFKLHYINLLLKIKLCVIHILYNYFF